jgi:hypothetical protein
MRKLLPLWCAVALLLVAGCPRSDHPVVATATNGPDPAPDVRQLREGIRDYSDAVVKQAAAVNDVLKNPTITDTIKQYEALKPEERTKYVIDNKEKMANVYDLVGKNDEEVAKAEAMATAHIDRLMAKMSGKIFVNMPPADFNLAMAKTEVHAKQVKMTDEFFGDMDSEAKSAVESFNKFTPEQKKTFLMSPDISSNALYWQYLYYQRKVALLWYLRNYAIQTEWGYKTPVSMNQRAALEEAQFDLRRTKH